MKKMICKYFLLISLLAFALSGCKAQPAPSQETSPKAAGPESTQPAAGKALAREDKWADTLSKAKREGVVSIYSLWPPESRNALVQAFKNKYGIEIQFTAFGRGAEILAKVKAEERAGLKVVDAYGSGETTLLVILKPEGLLAPMEPLLILPEVKDPKAWRGDRVPFTDKEGMSLSLVGIVQRTVIYNTSSIKEGEITTYRDLLKPQYKGKVTLGDPTLSGAGNAFMMHLGENLWGEAEAKEFLRRMIKEQDMAIQRDNRLHVEWVAQGKYPVGLAPNDIHYTFIEQGAPIKHAIVKEDNRLTASTGGLSVAARPAHPNAAIVFMNWLMTKEGQTVFSRGVPSMRLDVPTEGVNPLLIPKPGEKYFVNTEEQLIARGRWLDIAKKVIEEASR